MTQQERFEHFHASHPEVYAEITRLARSAKLLGFNHFGIRTQGDQGSAY